MKLVRRACAALLVLLAACHDSTSGPTDSLRFAGAAALVDSAPPPPDTLPPPPAQSAARGPQTPTSGSAPVPPGAPLPGDTEIELAVVKSPLVGTFYQASEPGAPAFAEVGTVVKKGHVLCIIEAMKLMNEIESEYDGEIVSVYAENGQPVQYGERLFAIRTT